MILASYPRSGSNWLAMMVGELIAGRAIDYETHPFPVHAIESVGGEWRLATGGRLVKTHEGWRSEYRRALYLVRHPVDVAASYRALLPLLGYPDLDSRTFVRAWLRGELDGYGSWAENVETWLAAPAEVHILRYEDLGEAPAERVRAASTFLGLPDNPEGVERAVVNNTLESMRAKTDRLVEIRFGGRVRAVHTPRLPDGRPGNLDAEDIALIEHRFAPTMRKLGYVPDPRALAAHG